MQPAHMETRREDTSEVSLDDELDSPLTDRDRDVTDAALEEAYVDSPTSRASRRLVSDRSNSKQSHLKPRLSLIHI